ncbi:MAG: pyrimidine/purine nucleoside phosphorylase, partial [Elusimicrobiota bacterium]
MGELPIKLYEVSIKLKANIYFDGGVVSHTILSKDGKRQTIGAIRPGQYHFKTEEGERMDIIS